MHHTAEALVLTMFTVACTMTYLILRGIYDDIQTAHTIEGLYKRFERAIGQLPVDRG